MNISEYLQSRFVQSQTILHTKQTTSEHAKNHAILAWMWIALKIATAFYFLSILMNYFAVLFHIAEKPRAARDIARDYQLEEMRKREEANKFVEDQVKAAMKSREEAGLDASPGKGTA